MFHSRRTRGTSFSGAGLQDATDGRTEPITGEGRPGILVRIDDEHLKLLLIEVRPSTCLTTSVSLQLGYCHVSVPSLSDIRRLGIELGDLRLTILCLRGASGDEREAEAAIAHLAATIPEAPVLVLSDRPGMEDLHGGSAFAAVEGMASGLSPGTIVRAISQAFRLEAAAPSGAPERNGMDGAAFSFTGRESQVLRLLRQGRSNKFIAHELRLCESTVKVHVHSIMKKMRATNRTEVVCLLNGQEGTG